MNSPADRSPQPPNEGHEHRITTLEEKVEAQHQELLSLRQHIDNSLSQLELRMRVELKDAEQRLTELIINRIDAIEKRHEERFRWLFGLAVMTLLSNGAAILTFTNVLLNR